MAKHLHQRSKWRGALIGNASLMRRKGRARHGNPFPPRLCFSWAPGRLLFCSALENNHNRSPVLPPVMSSPPSVSSLFAVDSLSLTQMCDWVDRLSETLGLNPGLK